MRKYTICVPLCATAMYEIEAENLEEAHEIAEDLILHNKIDYDGYDPENSLDWWIDEE